jgi:amino acid transporter
MASPRDVELSNFKGKEDSFTHGSSYSMREPDYYDERTPRRIQRFIDSFKRDENLSFFPSDHLSQVNSRTSQRRHGSITTTYTWPRWSLPIPAWLGS